MPGLPQRLIAPLLSALLAASAAQASADNCLPLAAAAESHYGIPPGLLQAMALVESGRSGAAWPWTLNVDGLPLFLPDRAEAIRVGKLAINNFHDSVAVGCLQIHLRWHTKYFESLSHLLDPHANVDYAARFLTELREQHGSWLEAVSRYHASRHDAKVNYLCSVLRARVTLKYQRVTPAMCSLCPSAPPCNMQDITQ